jgi:hypothetical protein
MIEDAVERSKELFGSGLYRAESVLMAVAEEHGMRCRCIPRIATC